MKQRIVLLASGNGSNVENICRFFESNSSIEIAGVYTNNPKAGVIQRLQPLDIQVKVFERNSFLDGTLLSEIQSLKPDLIVLAGFLWKITKDWVQAFPNQIINIHPALSPKYGGKGMYGGYVHQAVKENRESETGITIHYVNEAYDEGAIIFQKKVSLHPNDSTETIATKVHQLEYAYFPKVINSLLNKERP
ncbi:phosphoribosylglycinamide formyltransferase [Flavobacteriaceae bacterium]|nr:phosphoribosylglycinamide formyltransferase [Flavobacteriaceae bacterium]